MIDFIFAIFVFVLKTYYSRDGFNWDYYELLNVKTTPVQVKMVNGLFVIILKPLTWDPYMVFYGTDITNLKRVDAVGMRIILDICYMPDKQKYVALATGDSIAYAVASIDSDFENVINDECASQPNIGTLAHKNVGMHSMVYVQTEDDDHPLIYIYSSPTDSGSSALQKVDLDVISSQLTTIFSPSSMAKHLITYDNGNGTQSLITTDTLNGYYACYKNDHEFMADSSLRNFLAAYLPEQDKFIVFCGHKEHEEYSAYLTTFDKLINHMYQEDRTDTSHSYVGWAIASNGQRCVVIGPYGLLVWDNVETTDAYTIKITYNDGRTADEPVQLQRTSSQDIKGFVSDDKAVIPQPVIFDQYQIGTSQSTVLTVPGDGTKNLSTAGIPCEVRINLGDNPYYATVYDNEGIGEDAQITLDYLLKKIDTSIIFQTSMTTQNCGWLDNATCIFIMNFADYNTSEYLPLIDNCRFSNGAEVYSGEDYAAGDELNCYCFGLFFTYGAHQLFVWFKDGAIMSPKTIE